MAEGGAGDPIACIVIGMAGAGKSTLMQRICAYLSQQRTSKYAINVDPAVVGDLQYPVNIDIRNSVDYKQTMKDYGLGPNGAIMTSLNMFAAQFDEVISLCEAKKDKLKYILVDTPGQIEVFTWSASGAIITELLGITFPTVILFVVDTARSTSPTTFMNNMLYACSIMYKTGLPFIMVFNKCDVVENRFAIEWMTDLDLFEDVLMGEETYMSNLTKSMAQVLQKFYRKISTCSVSAVTGNGMEQLFEAIEKARELYHSDYRASLMKRVEAKRAQHARQQEEENELKEPYPVIADLLNDK